MTIDLDTWPTCEWFARCDHPADLLVSHPILGEVPCCNRCRERVGIPEEEIVAYITPAD